jgi:hypothetical protein
VREKPK